MRALLTGTVTLFQHTIDGWLRDRAQRQAAALAYYGVLSLAPLLIIAISIAGFFFGRADVRAQVVANARAALGPGAAGLIDTVLSTTYTGSGGLVTTLFSLVVVLFAATNIFFQLKKSLNLIWGVEADDDTRIVDDVLKLAGDRLVAALMVIGVGVLFLLLQALSATIGLLVSVANTLALDTPVLLSVLNPLLSIGFGAFIIALIFRFLPDTRLAWRDVFAGAIFTAVLFAIGQRAIRFYLANSTIASAYGVAGSVIVALLWIYYSASILLFGAEFTQAFARLYGSLKNTPGKQQTPGA